MRLDELFVLAAASFDGVVAFGFRPFLPEAADGSGSMGAASDLVADFLERDPLVAAGLLLGDLRLVVRFG